MKESALATIAFLALVIAYRLGHLRGQRAALRAADTNAALVRDLRAANKYLADELTAYGCVVGIQTNATKRLLLASKLCEVAANLKRPEFSNN